MKKIIIKNLLEKIGEDELPTTKKQFQRLYYSPYVTLGSALLLLDEYEEYSELWMECFSVILDNTNFDAYSHTILNDLLEKITNDFENKKLSSENYYTIIKQICDNYNICRNISMDYLLSIIDKCDDKFIKNTLSISISKQNINYFCWDKYHHLIDWKIFQENNDICIILDDAADDCENDDVENEIINSLITKDYLINNLDYNKLILQTIDTDCYFLEYHDDILMELLNDYEKYHISFNALCDWCERFFMTSELIEFICTKYKPDNKSWDYHKKELIVSIMINNLTKQRLELVIHKYPSFFLKSEDIRSLIKQEFKWNWKMRKFIRKFKL